MADLVTRLLLENKQFSDSLNKSTRQVQSFQQNMDRRMKTVSSSFHKVTGALGLAFGAVETFNTAMNSTVSSQKALRTATDLATASVSEFFKGLITGDDTAFFTRIDNINKKIKSTYDIINNQKVRQILMDRFDSQIIELKEKADVEKDPEKKKQYLSQAKGLEKQSADLALRSEAEYKDFYKNFLNGLSAGSSKFFQGNKGISDLYTLADKTSPERKKIDKYSSLKSELESKYTTKTYGVDLRGNSYVSGGIVDYEAVERELKKRYGAELDYYERTRILVEGLNTENIGILESINSAAATLKKDAAGTKGDVKTIQGTIKSTKPTKVLTEVELEPKRVIINTKKLEGKLPIPTVSLPTNFEGNKGGGGDLPYTSDSDAYSGTIEGLTAVNTLLTSIGQNTSEGAAAWLTYGSNILAATATAIPAIMALTTAKKAEATANAAAATTGAASSVASIPIVGWVMALAAVGGLIASFAAIPKFANGGVVGGNSFSGDNILARLNSGEMVLNQNQQSNLFKKLNSSNSNTASDVRFRIDGTTLVGVLNNATRKRNRYEL